MSLRLSDFDYNLPNDLIADRPSVVRDQSRLLVLDRKNDTLSDRQFLDIAEFLQAGDVLVLNNSKVFPARLLGQKETGGKVEILLDHEIRPGVWRVVGKGLKVGSQIIFGRNILKGRVLTHGEDTYEVEFDKRGENFWALVEKIGKVPLPPYIEAKRDSGTNFDDKERYQTVYARETGSSAAPTAGLHFTQSLLSKLKERGVKIVELALHVGLGTFLPVKEEDISKHVMHEEFFRISKENLALIDDTKKKGGKIFAVGTTSVRVLETIANKKFEIQESGGIISGWTNIFIYPPYTFQYVDAFITNFHLPKSTLLMLVSAFASRDKIISAYEHAISNKYHFYSYGDAMLIV